VRFCGLLVILAAYTPLTESDASSVKEETIDFIFAKEWNRLLASKGMCCV
jgi:hypothetical protein